MKRVFPKEFSDLLNKKGLLILAGNADGQRDKRIAVVQNIIRSEYVEVLVKEMEQQLYPLLKNYYAPIPEDLIRKMRKNYSEKLGKSMKMKSAEMNAKNSLAYKKGVEMGLVAMLNSQSYKRMGEELLGAKFGESNGNQVICYRHGDYVSPHNDHHPEDANSRKGYFDIQFMLSNKYVKYQWLVYEKNGFLNSMADISTPSGISVYRLPFWHYTTPMISHQGKQQEARRWLLLHSFEYPV